MHPIQPDYPSAPDWELRHLEVRTLYERRITSREAYGKLVWELRVYYSHVGWQWEIWDVEFLEVARRLRKIDDEPKLAGKTFGLRDMGWQCPGFYGTVFSAMRAAEDYALTHKRGPW